MAPTDFTDTTSFNVEASQTSRPKLRKSTTGSNTGFFLTRSFFKPKETISSKYASENTELETAVSDLNGNVAVLGSGERSLESTDDESSSSSESVDESSSSSSDESDIGGVTVR